MKTYTTTERQATAIPVSEVLDSEGSVEIYPEVREKGYFDLDFRGGKLVVVGGKYIGHIPLNSRILIDVQPKVGIARLAQILETAREPLRCLHLYRRAYKTNDFVGLTIFEVLVKALIASTRVIVSEGLLREYQSREHAIPRIRGRIKPLETILKNHARGDYTHAVCRYFEFGSNNPLNRLIKYAIWYSGQHLISLGSTNILLRQQLADVYEYLEPVPLDLSMRFINEAHTYLATQKIPSIRSYYLEACDTALAIINDSGLDLLTEGRDVHLSSFLVDMESVFESYVRNVLRTGQEKFGVRVLDGNTEGRGWLFSDNKAYEAKPDFILRSKQNTLLIGDCKYKAKLVEQDRYQVIAHALSFDAKRVCIVMPTAAGETSSLERIGKIGPAPGIELFTYRLKLDADDLVAEESDLVNEVFGLCVAGVEAAAT